MIILLDLHVHSNSSFDSILSPKIIAKLIKRQGLHGYALTDHDTVDNLEEAGFYAKKSGLIFIPGIERKTDKGDILGLFITENIISYDFEEVISEITKPVETPTLPDKPQIEPETPPLPPTPEPKEIIPVEPPVDLGVNVLENFEDISDWDVRVYPEETVLASINQSATIAKSGMAGQLSYDFTAVPAGKRAAAYIKAEKMIPMGIDEISLWVYGNGSGHSLKIRFLDAKGIKFVADLASDIDWYNEWKLLTIRMSDIYGFEDGQENLKPQLPLTLSYIYIYLAPTDKRDVSNIYFDDFMVK